MEYTSNSTELLQRLQAFRQRVASGIFSDALVAGLNAGRGAMVRRIFNQSLDANGESLGPYFSEQYARDRRRKGRQTDHKDLQVTGALKADIQTVTINNTRAEVRFTNDELAQIARYQEQQIYNLRTNTPANEASGGRVPIFEFSADEQAISRSTTNALLAQKLKV